MIDGRSTAEELHKEVTAQKELVSVDPAFAAYVYAQIQVSVMSEQLTALKEMPPWTSPKTCTCRKDRRGVR